MSKRKWYKAINVAVILAVMLVFAFLPVQQVTIKGIGGLSLETPTTLSVGAEEVYASSGEITINAEFSANCEGGTSWYTGVISSGQWRHDSFRSGIDFDTTDIPDGAIITKVELRIHIVEEHGKDMNNDVAKMTSKAKTYYDANNYSGFNDDVDGNEYLSNSYAYYGEGTHTVELLAAARTDLQAQLGDNWFSVGWTGTTEAKNRYRDGSDYTDKHHPPQLIVTYMVPTWESYRDVNHEYQDDDFADYNTEHYAYMKGEGFILGHSYKIAYYDASDNKTSTEQQQASSDTGVLTSSTELKEGYAADGYWHAVVLDTTETAPDTYDAAKAHASYVIDDDFYIHASAIPEFPTVISAITAMGLCFGIYWWMRRRVCNRVR